jgi:DNA cross-link repair 1C protein
MRSLFGHLCSGDEFLHDRHMKEINQRELRPNKRARRASSSSQMSYSSSSRVAIDGDNSSCPAAESPSRIDYRTTPAATKNLNSDKASVTSPQPEKQGPPQPEAARESCHDEGCGESMRRRIRSIRSFLERRKDRMLFSNSTLPAPIQYAAERKEREQGLADQQQQDQLKTAYETKREIIVEAASESSIETSIGLESQLSVSDSAFDDDSQPQLQPPQRHQQGNALVKRRKAAYRAAQAHSYDAWSQFALLSAGNNHMEEEIEL